MNEIIRQWLIAVLGYDDQHVIRAQQEGPIPVGPHAEYLILSEEGSAHSISKSTDVGPQDDYTITYYNRGELIVQVDIYSTSKGRDLQRKLTHSSELLAIRKILQPEGVSLIRSSVVRNLTALVDTKHKERWSCDHTFYLWNEIEEVNEKINAGYKITGQYQPGDEETVIEVP